MVLDQMKSGNIMDASYVIETVSIFNNLITYFITLDVLHVLNNITIPAQRQLFCHVDVRCGVLGRNKILFYKIILNVKSSTSNTDVYHELGRYPLYINRCVRIIKYWGKIIQFDNVFIKL